MAYCPSCGEFMYEGRARDRFDTCSECECEREGRARAMEAEREERYAAINVSMMTPEERCTLRGCGEPSLPGREHLCLVHLRKLESWTKRLSPKVDMSPKVDRVIEGLSPKVDSGATL